MAFVERGNSRIYYDCTGRGPALVFSHGVGGNHASWYPQIAAMSDRYRVITWDHRGFGNSSDAEGMGRSGFIDDLKAVLDAEDIDRCILIGQSMGGGTSLGFACTYPDRIAGLIMADSLAQAELPAEIVEPMAENSRTTADLTQLERVLGVTFRRENRAAAILYSQIASFNTTSLKTLTGHMPTFNAETLTRTGIPTLFMVGEEDILFPPWAVRAYQRCVGKSRYVEFARTGHSACFERPDAFNSAVENWLDQIGFAPR